MEQRTDIKSLLEWYIEAGVTESCGSEAGLVTVQAESKPAPSAVPSATKGSAVQNDTILYQRAPETARQAISNLAQATPEACKNARELCDKALSLEQLKEIVENFEGCALKFNAKNTVFGAGNDKARVMIIGEAPGADEDRIGKPFVGRSGHLLEKMLNAIGLNREEVYITNVLPWRPPGNRTPTDGEVAVCLPFLKKQIELIKPQIILLLGGSAANALLDNNEPISKLRGRWLEYTSTDKSKIAALASFHPAFLLRNSAQKGKAWVDFLRVLKKLKEN